MNHFVFSAVLAFYSTLFAAIFSFRQKKPILRIFGFYWSVICFWSFMVASQSRLLEIMPSRLWGWFLHLGCIFIPAAFLHFVVYYCDLKAKKEISTAAHAVSIIYLLLNSLTPNFTFGTAYRDHYAYPIPSTFYLYYFLTFVAMVSLAVIFLFIKIVKASNKGWLLVFTILSAAAYLGGMDNFLIMADIRLYPLYPFGLYFVTPYAIVGSIAVYEATRINA